MKLILTSKASLELEAAAAWYEEQRQGLGFEFLRAVDVAMLKIARTPTLYTIAIDEIRRCLLKKFPFGIFFSIEEDHIVVVSIFHSRRDPKKIKK